VKRQDINCSSQGKQHTSIRNFLSLDCCLKTPISKHLLATCYSSVTTGFLTYSNTAVSVTRVTLTTFSPFIRLEFLLLHSRGCQLISDEYEWMNEWMKENNKNLPGTWGFRHWHVFSVRYDVAATGKRLRRRRFDQRPLYERIASCILLAPREILSGILQTWFLTRPHIIAFFAHTRPCNRLATPADACHLWLQSENNRFARSEPTFCPGSPRKKTFASVLCALHGKHLETWHTMDVISKWLCNISLALLSPLTPTVAIWV